MKLIEWLLVIGWCCGCLFAGTLIGSRLRNAKAENATHVLERHTALLNGQTALLEAQLTILNAIETLQQEHIRATDPPMASDLLAP